VADTLTTTPTTSRTAPPQVRRRARWISTGLALVIAVLWGLPLLWALSSSFEGATVDGNRLLPKQPTLANWGMLVDPSGRAVNIFVAFFNSTVVAISSTVLALLVCSIAGYALAKLPFRGNSVVFGLLLVTMLIPNEVVLVPLFQQFNQLGLLNTYGALALPHIVSLLGVVLIRQFIVNLPDDLTDAARIDGANAWQTYRYIVVPLIRPAMATLGILVFLGAWNDFLWPLISTSSPAMQTLPLALVTFRSAYGDIDYGVVMASTILAITPPLLVFLFAQRFIIEGISSTGLKG
jgi:multiple sugar transport system permease protein